MSNRKRQARESTVSHDPRDLVAMYHPELLIEGVDPAEQTAVTTFEAYENLWAEKGYLLLEEDSVEPPATAPINDSQE